MLTLIELFSAVFLFIWCSKAVIGPQPGEAQGVKPPKKCLSPQKNFRSRGKMCWT